MKRRKQKVRLDVYEALEEEFNLRVDLIESLNEDMADCRSAVDKVEDDIYEFEMAIRDWHDTEHAEGWATCGHVVCRAAIGY